MSRVAIVLTIIIASVSLAHADETTTTVRTENANGTTVHSTTVHSHHPRHHPRHHRFHPVHEASKIIHDATGTEPTRPKPVTN